MSEERLRSLLRRKMNGTLSLLLRSGGVGRVLLYHEIAETGDSTLTVSPSLFRSHLEWLAESGHHCTTVSESRYLASRTSIGLSFDDGLASSAKACSVVLDRKWSATLFVVPAWVDDGKRGILSWGELADLAAGGIEIGAHGLAHERLCGPDVMAIAEELARARARIEQRLQIRVTGMAYPEGLAPLPARRAAMAAGYKYACTTLPGSNRRSTDPYEFRRNEILFTDDRPRLLLGKLAGSDDWMAPIRRYENGRRCRAEARRSAS